MHPEVELNIPRIPCTHPFSPAMSNYHPQSQDMYHDNPSARSPGSQRHQQPLHRQPSRQFDAYGPMPTNFYDDPMSRYDTSRLERLNPSLHGNTYGYDMSGSQTWAAPNGFSGAHTLGGLSSAAGRMKTNSRGRTGLPTVCVPIFPCVSWKDGV